MLTFRVKNIMPPGGRFFVDLDGERIEGLTWSGFFVNVRNWYVKQKRPVPDDIEEQVMDFMCRRLPEGFCTGTMEGGVRVKVLTLQQIRMQTQSMIFADKTRVTFGQAKARAAACSQCPMNDRSTCPSCVGLNSWAARAAGVQLRAPLDWLGVCTVDGTALVAKVYVGSVPNNPDYPDNCWRTRC